MPVQNRSSGNTNGTGTSAGNVSLNNGTEPNRLLTALVSWWDPDLTGAALSSIDSGGTPLTLLSAYTAGTNRNLLYYLKTPPSGITATNIAFTANAWWGLIVNVWTGVDLVSTFGTVQQANGTSAAPSLTVPNVSVQDAIWDALTIGPGSDGITVTPDGPNQTLTATVTLPYDAANTLYVSSSRSTLVGGNSTTRSYTLSASRAWRMQAVQLKHQQYGATIFGRL
jgi:hypothetical protein